MYDTLSAFLWGCLDQCVGEIVLDVLKDSKLVQSAEESEVLGGMLWVDNLYCGRHSVARLMIFA